MASLDAGTGNLTLGIIDEVAKRRTEAAGGVFYPIADQLEQGIVLENFKSIENRIESFQFSDGTALTDQDLYSHFFESLLTPVNSAPVVKEEDPYMMLGLPDLTGRIEATDVDGDTLYYAISTVPGHGLLTVDDQGKWTYRPETGYYGEDSAQISVSDGAGGETKTSLHFLVNTYVEGQASLPEKTAEAIFLKDIGKADLTFTQDGDTLVIDVRQKGSLRLEGYFAAPENGVKRIVTTDGPVNLEKDYIVDMADWRSVIGGIARGIQDDRLLVFGSSCLHTLSGAMNNDVLLGSGSGDFLMGLDGDDTMIGGSGKDSLFGNDGEDTIYGDRGNDYLSGGSGKDFLGGGDDQDKLDGGAENDILNGGTGKDILTGGAGDDTFVFDTALSSASNVDSITDFTKGWTRSSSIKISSPR